ncbi:MAG: hypothetical protein VCB42_00470 [Myxococcota bacterium]
MPAFETLFPRQANNDYRGSRVAWVGAFAFMAIFTFRSLVHFLKGDSGVNSIASIIIFPGNPDPNNVIYMFSSAWGTQQLITLLIYGVILWRYRNLLPLMYALIVLECILRFFVGVLHPLTADFYAHTPPGKLANLPMLLVAGLMLVLSLRERGSPRAEPA